MLNERQNELLKRLKKSIDRAVGISAKEQDLVLLASELRAGYTNITELLGTQDSEEILNYIFKGFCVGK